MSLQTPDRVDPITFEVIRNALLEATEEMTIALRRSAYSTNIKTRADFSCAFFDRELRLVVQSFGQPTHLGSLVELVPKAIIDYGVENIGPGDTLLVNDPYGGGGHLNDITLITPVYYDDEPFGYVANVAHHVDVGGRRTGERRRIPRSLSRGGHHSPCEVGAGWRNAIPTFFDWCSLRSDRSAKLVATFGHRWRRTPPVCVG